MAEEKDPEEGSAPKQPEADQTSRENPSHPSPADQTHKRKYAAESDGILKKETQGNPIESLDYTADRPIAHEATPSLYDARPGEDSARRRIAYLLIALLFIIIIWILWMTAAGVIDTDDLKEFSVILSPIITLVSAATGFYYGTKSK